MTDQELEQLRYPIGKLSFPETITENHISEWIDVLEQFPSRLEALVINLTDEQLETPYRPGGWTIKQTVHHVSDSHHHSYIRFKWALTEDTPLIKAYNQEDWAKLVDYDAPIMMSLQHLKVVHSKLVYVLKLMSAEDFEKGFIHPETNKLVKLKENVGVYAWHSEHHYAHIENVLKRKGWL